MGKFLGVKKGFSTVTPSLDEIKEKKWKHLILFFFFGVAKTLQVKSKKMQHISQIKNEYP